MRLKYSVTSKMAAIGIVALVACTLAIPFSTSSVALVRAMAVVGFLGLGLLVVAVHFQNKEERLSGEPCHGCPYGPDEGRQIPR